MVTKKAESGFNLLELSGYSSGGGLPEGDYVWKSLDVVMFAGTKQDGTSAGPERLGCRITMVPLAGGEERQQFYSFGGKAHESWAPNPQTGKGIIAVPGGPGTPPNINTNWAYLVKSLFDSGLPRDIVDGQDLSGLEGIWVHMHNIPEPEDRKGFVSKTGEAAQERKSNVIPVVSEIKEDGKPWEGTGGIPEAAEEAKPAPKAAAKAAPKAAAKPPAKAAPEPEPEAEGQSLEEIALSALSGVLGANMDAKGNFKKMFVLQLRPAMFKSLNASHPDNVQEIINSYVADRKALTNLLEQLGYTLAGEEVKSA